MGMVVVVVGYRWLCSCGGGSGGSLCKRRNTITKNYTTTTTKSTHTITNHNTNQITPNHNFHNYNSWCNHQNHHLTPNTTNTLTPLPPYHNPTNASKITMTRSAYWSLCCVCGDGCRGGASIGELEKNHYNHYYHHYHHQHHRYQKETLKNWTY